MDHLLALYKAYITEFLHVAYLLKRKVLVPTTTHYQISLIVQNDNGSLMLLSLIILAHFISFTIYLWEFQNEQHNKGTMINFSVSRPPRALIFRASVKKYNISFPPVGFNRGGHFRNYRPSFELGRKKKISHSLCQGEGRGTFPSTISLGGLLHCVSGFPTQIVKTNTKRCDHLMKMRNWTACVHHGHSCLF